MLIKTRISSTSFERYTSNKKSKTIFLGDIVCTMHIAILKLLTRNKLLYWIHVAYFEIPLGVTYISERMASFFKKCNHPT